MITLSNQQETAISLIKNWYDEKPKQVFDLAGLAGTGKSVLIAAAVDALNIPLESIAFLAPTGMAAKVMRAKLTEWDIDAVTSTIHKAMYVPRQSKPEEIEAELVKCRSILLMAPSNGHIRAKMKILEENLERAYNVNDLRFRMNPDSVLGQCKLIIIDEGSMVGNEIACDVKSWGVPILAVGDEGQLKPIGDTPGFCLGKPDAVLTEIHRQAKDNPIIAYSHLVRHGKSMPYGDYGALKIIHPDEDVFTCDMENPHQIIVGMNKTRWDITGILRKLKGITSAAPQKDEPLIICKNSKKHPDLVNGTLMTSTTNHDELVKGNALMTIKAKDDDGNNYNLKSVQCLFEENQRGEKGYSSVTAKENYRAKKEYEHVDFGWVLTCHKAQGSQWKRVIVHDESFAFKEDRINWLYTAATRAADELVVVKK
jgi:exodeoxyribonuclease-5